jgi:hypothetical protein
MKKLKQFMVVIAIGAIAISSCNRHDAPEVIKDPYSNQVILDWNEAIVIAMGGPSYQHSLLASRIGAMVHLAMHDAINAARPTYRSYAYFGKNEKADPTVAAAVAAHEVLVGNFPDKQSVLDSILNVSIQQVPDTDAKTNGIALGKAAAVAMLQIRADDGAFQDPIAPIEPSSSAGVYQLVPPFNFIFAPHWKTMKLFGLQKQDQFRSVPPPALNSDEYTEAFKEVQLRGQLQSTIRTAEQTEQAQFWYEFSEMGWNRVARVAIAEKKLGLIESARVMALVNMALADSYTAGWDSKFHYNLWRPYTAIRNAGQDGNTETVVDLTWDPLMPTPPVQDYPSTHSVLGNAGATVLTKLLGKNTGFSMTSTTGPEGLVKTFVSFLAAADENADSRVSAGIHFRFACDAGQEMGNKIGDYVVNNHLLPL